jgi:ATP-dependent helicase/nuclease subunit A
MTRVPADAAVRERIRVDLQTNLLVEAGAGSGKTTALVARLLQHVITGTSVEQLVAITFTRKAAEELRERLQIAVERAARSIDLPEQERSRCARAVQTMDRMFVGTIHAFCSRVLREYPIDAGLDPQFAEVEEADSARMHEAFWRGWVVQERRGGGDALSALAEVGLHETQLRDAFVQMVAHGDVEFPAVSVARPETTACVSALRALLLRANSLAATRPATAAPDATFRLVQRLSFLDQTSDWTDAAVVCAALEIIASSSLKPTQNRWSETKDGKAAIKQLGLDLTSWYADHALPTLTRWREYRYPLIISILKRAVHDYGAARQRNGVVSFDDLLLLTARLLRNHPEVRAELGERFRYLLVDEFQDTDPVQAEICLLLASPLGTADRWDAVVPRDGALFVVGDPKQSIYRFRRADIQVYERVKDRFMAFGDVLALTSNFRSQSAIADLVNTHFSTVFPVEATAEQAAFRPMIAESDRVTDGLVGVFTHCLTYEGSRHALLAADAASLASWIATQVRDGVEPAQFLLLTGVKSSLGLYARALADHGVPVTTAGAPMVFESELSELLVLLRALSDPDNAIAVVAALEGLAFGLTPADLYDARQRGMEFTISLTPVGEADPVADALRTLHAFWQRSASQPADVLLEQLALETGLLMFGAQTTRGDSRAGAIQRLIELVRARASAGGNSVLDAIAVAESLLATDADDTSIRGGTRSAVRVMNLHKAKGLEADVVVLAAPTDRPSHAPTLHITRAESGESRGGIVLAGRRGEREVVLAQPAGWDAMASAEEAFDAAEQDRLRYVAATRARHALVVSQAVKLQKTPKPDASLWRPFAEVLAERGARPLNVTLLPTDARQPTSGDVTTLTAEISRAEARVIAASSPSYTLATVTGGSEAPEAVHRPARQEGPQGFGTSWGTAVHRVLDGLLRGRTGEAYRSYTAAVAHNCALSPAQTEALMQLGVTLERDPRLLQLRTSGQTLSELHLMEARPTRAGVTLLHGVIDAATRSAEGWHVTDWKSDVIDAAAWAAREPAYQAQANMYAEALHRISGTPSDASVERIMAPPIEPAP